MIDLETWWSVTVTGCLFVTLPIMFILLIWWVGYKIWRKNYDKWKDDES